MSAKSPRSFSPTVSLRKIIAMGVLAGAGFASAQTVMQLPDSLYNAGDTIAWVKKIPTFCEGPVWDAATGSVYFTRQQLQSTTWPIIRVKPGVDTGVVWVASPGEANGLDLDPQGRLVAAQRGRLTRYKADGSVDSVLFTSPNNGVTVGLINDLSIGGNGAIYFTTNGSQIYYLSPDRLVTLAYSGAASANGIEWVMEDSAVYVNEQRQVKRYKVNPNGTLTNPTTFITVAPGTGGTYADGGTIDAHGNRYIANFTLGEIKIFNARGDSIGRIVPRVVTSNFEGFSGGMGNVSNIIFGGPDLKTMYFTGDGGLYALRMKIPGWVRQGYTTSLRTTRLPVKFNAVPQSLDAARDVRGRLISAPAQARAQEASTPVFHAPTTTQSPSTKN
jgi:sugar lactone lactonase YvrE